MFWILIPYQKYDLQVMFSYSMGCLFTQLIESLDAWCEGGVQT